MTRAALHKSIEEAKRLLEKARTKLEKISLKPEQYDPFQL